MTSFIRTLIWRLKILNLVAVRKNLHILCDDDVNKFYSNLFKYCDSASENAKKVKEMLEESKED